MAQVVRRIAFAIACAVASVAMPAGAAPRALTPADIDAIVTVRDAQISPDGSRIATIESRADLKKDRYVPTLVFTNVRTHARTVVTRERSGVSSPRWSPDGKSLAYIAIASASVDPKAPKPKAQIHLVGIGGDPFAVTATKNGVRSFAWSPDGKRFAYVTDDDNPDQAKIDAHDDAFEITQQPWNAKRAPQSAHLWTIAVSGGRSTRITHGAWSVIGDPAWSRDGMQLTFTRSPDSFPIHVRGNDVAVANVRSGAVRILARGSLAASDGTRIAFTFPDPRARVMSDLGVMDFRGARRATISGKLDRDVRGAAFAPDGAIVTAAVDGTHGHAYRLEPDGSVTTLSTGDAAPQSFSIARNGMLAFTGATATDPSELFVLGGQATAAQQLSHFNAGLAVRTLGPRRTLRWHGADGTLVDGVVTTPPALVAGKTYPTVLVIHGGPTSATTTSFSDLAAFLAQRGMIVFEPNYRGSDNHGAASIASSIPHVASIAGDDILRGVAALEGAYPVDAKRIGVSGWSAGGWMTTWLIAHDTRWKAALAGAAVADATYVAMMSDAQDYGHALLGGHAVWESPEIRASFRNESAMIDAANVKTPTLIITDAGDQRVPEPTSYAFYHELRAAGTPVKLLVYPVDGHYPSDPVRRADVTKRWMEWFAQQL